MISCTTTASTTGTGHSLISRMMGNVADSSRLIPRRPVHRQTLTDLSAFLLPLLVLPGRQGPRPLLLDLRPRLYLDMAHEHHRDLIGEQRLRVVFVFARNRITFPFGPIRFVGDNHAGVIRANRDSVVRDIEPVGCASWYVICGRMLYFSPSDHFTVPDSESFNHSFIDLGVSLRNQTNLTTFQRQQ